MDPAPGLVHFSFRPRTGLGKEDMPVTVAGRHSSEMVLSRRVDPMVLSLSSAGVTDVGRVRSRNEDRYLLHQNLVAVADGMGGHLVGDKAAEMVIAALAAVDWAELTTDTERVALLGRQLTGARKSIVEMVEGDISETTETRIGAQPGAGTTLAGVLYCQEEPDGTVPSIATGSSAEDNRLDGHWLVFHIGDSRVYLWRQGELVRLTKDHSLVQELVDCGELTEAEAHRHPRRHVITRAIGIYDAPESDDDPEPEVGYLPTVPGDVLLVCSDGLTDTLTDSQITAVIEDLSGDSLEALVFALRDVAVSHGGRDNVTVVTLGSVDSL
ncbi:protein phosphatase 2C domain-containing protein [Actinobaculum sp. 313]|uniref:PP2C family protein-serine/threonine phosphatase n=1 Tax=Actinobaculum sp. 313 TaxID=2495645 RepID=UPI000D525CE7|nr:protein phosphatase 2C domain-containing protein [Actinobaculum sp. 313]AWE42302.1 hypothetical protein DDD63_05555 [Actinobaculum sp. 313]